MSASLNFDTEQLSSMELYSLQLQKVVADFTDFDAITKQYVDQKVSQAKQELTDGASSALDTFRELEDYLTASGVAGGLVEQIAALSASITAEANRAGTEEGKLDARVTTLENSSVSANLQSELDATQQGAGLDLDGSYVADAARNYISGATSLKSADALLDNAIKAEVDRAEAAEAKIASDLAAEQSTRFTQNVAATNDRAAIRSEFGSADTTLQTQIDELSGNNSVVSTDLQSEITRAKAREDQIESDLFVESERATNKEGELQAAIDNEALRATGIENDIKSDLTSEVARATDAENALGVRIDELNTANVAEDPVNLYYTDTRVKNANVHEFAPWDPNNRVRDPTYEMTATYALGLLKHELNDIHAKEDADDIRHTENYNAINSEISRAEDAELVLQSNIDAEKARAEDAEGVLQESVQAETARAEGVETNLAEGINLLGERPHDGANGGFDIQHVEGSDENKYMYFSKFWRMHGSSDGKRLIFEYNKGTPENPIFVSAVPFISHH